VDFSIKIVQIKRSAIRILLSADELSGEFECNLVGKYKALSGNLVVMDGSEKIPLELYLSDNPLTFQTTDDSKITGFEITSGDPSLPSFDQNVIEAIDWKTWNTDLKLEFGKSTKGKLSIQDTLLSILCNDENNKYILYDHGSGEMADYITIKVENNEYIVSLFHVKKMSGKKYNSSVGDLYEVVGQALKSMTWLTSKGMIIEKMNQRHNANHCIVKKGSDYNDIIQELRGTSLNIKGEIVIVQPALSKTEPMPDKMQSVLAAASSFIRFSGRIRKLRIMGSK